jgi:hypothetical protein
MTPKEKAIELIDKFRLNVVDYEGSGLNDFKAKQCALIAVDEILQITWVDKFLTVQDYWNEVKQEIEKL